MAEKIEFTIKQTSIRVRKKPIKGARIFKTKKDYHRSEKFQKPMDITLDE